MAIFLLIVLIAIALGIVGFVIKGLLYLLVIGVIIFVLNLIWAGTRIGRGRGNSRLHR